jgi:hypothetical protein
MFFPGSRYLSAGRYSAVLPDGSRIDVVRIPARRTDPVLGYHRRLDGQRLDHVAGHFLGDPTAFWRICDAASGVLPDAIASRELVPIPRKGP